MKKFWKVILWVGGFIGAIFVFFLGKRKKTVITPPFEDKIEAKEKEIKKVQEKSSKVKKEKKEVKNKIKNTSNKISKTKSKIKDIKSAKDTINDFEKKYRKN